MSPLSGITQVILNYYRFIDKSKIQFDFLSFEKSVHPKIIEEIEKLGGNIYYLPTFSLLHYRDFKKQLSDFFSIHGKKYKAVHSHCFQLSSIVFKYVKKNGINRCIAHSHSSKLSANYIKNIRNIIISKSISSHATDYFACSEKAGVCLFGKHVVSKKKLFLMKNAIDCAKFEYNENTRQKIRNELLIDGKFIIGHVGRFSKEKNHLFLLKIFIEVKKIQDNAVLLLIGEGDMKEKVKDFVCKNNLNDSVFFLGRRSDVNVIMQGMDRFVLPSLFEGLGMVLIEAQVAGLPCFVSDVIPIETKLSDNIEFISLKKAPSYWAQRILRNNNERVSRIDIAKEKGYDINNAAHLLAQHYLSL
jgi:glycosyltransferase involved in cell wall biosynthesis